MVRDWFKFALTILYNVVQTAQRILEVRIQCLDFEEMPESKDMVQHDQEVGYLVEDIFADADAKGWPGQLQRY